ncbi:hypothetical protein VDGL01_10011 [Verticillium dahliae]
MPSRRSLDRDCVHVGTDAAPSSVYPPLLRFLLLPPSSQSDQLMRLEYHVSSSGLDVATMCRLATR